ncbi:MAG: hypothetical protein AAGF59_12430 [Pseudomonadota bacterium]
MSTTLWPRSGDIQTRKGRLSLAVGAKAQFFIGGTTTPKTVYTDAIATTAHDTASLVTDGNGQWPAVFVPFGTYDFRILDSDDTIIFTASEVPNPEPVAAGGTTTGNAIATGMMVYVPAKLTFDGYVRANGRSIGSGASSATERSNDDTEALFTWLWNSLANDQASVSGGRGSSASADWAANKTIALPDMRSSVPMGLDDMGNSAAGLLLAAPFTNGSATLGGSIAGNNTHALSISELPGHAHGIGTITVASVGGHSHTLAMNTSSAGSHTHGVSDPGHVHTVSDYRTTLAVDSVIEGTSSTVVGATGFTGFSSSSAQTGVSLISAGEHAHTISGATNAAGDHTHSLSGETASIGSGTAINVVCRSVLGTWLIKL